MRTSIIFALGLALCACAEDGGETPQKVVDAAVQVWPDAGHVVDAAVPVPVSVKITSPDDYAVVSTNSVNVSGTVTGTNVVTVNGVTATVANGTFTASVPLESEGDHPITAVAGDFLDQITVTLDQTPPLIDFVNPVRGSHIDSLSTTLRFNVEENTALDALTLDGTELSTYLIPDVQLNQFSLSRGLNMLLVQATDLARLSAREHSAILAGPLTEPSEKIKNAIRVHIGKNAISTLEGMLADVLDNLDVESLLGEEGWQAGSSNFGIRLNSVTFNTPDDHRVSLSLDESNSELDFALQFLNLRLNFDLLILNGSSIPCTASTQRLDVTGGVHLAVQNGSLVTELSDLSVDFTGLNLSLGSSSSESPNATVIEGLLGDVVEFFVTQKIPPLVHDLLAVIEEPVEFSVLGADLRVRLHPTLLKVTNTGISARIDVFAELLSEPVEPPISGYVGTPAIWEGVPETDDVAISVDDDLLNALLYQIWRGGGLFPIINQAFMDEHGSQLRIVLSFFGSLLSKVYSNITPATPLALHAMPQLPIQVRFLKNANEQIEIGMGAIQINVLTDDAQAVDLLQGSASLKLSAKVAVKAASEATHLQLNLGEHLIAFDVETDSLRGAVEASVEQPLLNVVESLLPIIPTLLSSISLPAIPFVSLKNIRVYAEPDSAVYAEPDSAGFLTINAELK